SALRAASVRDANPSGPAGPCRSERSPRSASVRDATRPVPNAARERPRSGPGASLHFLDARLLRGLLTEERARACDEVEDELELLLAVAPDQRAERDSEGAEEPFRLARGLPFLGRNHENPPPVFGVAFTPHQVRRLEPIEDAGDRSRGQVHELGETARRDRSGLDQDADRP